MDITFQSLQKIKTENINITDIGQNLIQTQIKNIRSMLSLQQGDSTATAEVAGQTWSPLDESYCHAFYRVLGLPVIHKNKTDFYNPGHFGSEDTVDEKTRRALIDNSQDTVLLEIERKREQSCTDNNISFTSAGTKLQYRLDMMLAPIPINLLDPSDSFDPFSIDKLQIITNFKNRTMFKKVTKILRPFKCTPFITNRIIPITNRICAPFIIQNDATVHGNSLTSSYLEFVCRVRFASDVSKTGNSELYQSLYNQINALNYSNGDNILSKFAENIASLSDVEAYIFVQLFKSYISICFSIKDNINKCQKLAAEIFSKIYLTGENVSINNQGDITLSNIDKQIAIKKSQRAEKNFILAQLPVSTNFVDGIRLANPINCITNTTFVSLVQGDIAAIDNQIKELEQQKNNQLKLFNSINDTFFYVLGEVNGLGIIDITALMISFWLLPQDQLLSMLDEAAFKRLYRETQLHNSVVESRKNSNVKTNIGDVIKSMDKIVFNLLKIGSDIVAASNTTK